MIVNINKTLKYEYVLCEIQWEIGSNNTIYGSQTVIRSQMWQEKVISKISDEQWNLRAHTCPSLCHSIFPGSSLHLSSPRDTHDLSSSQPGELRSQDSAGADHDGRGIWSRDSWAYPSRNCSHRLMAMNDFSSLLRDLQYLRDFRYLLMYCFSIQNIKAQKNL